MSQSQTDPAPTTLPLPSKPTFVNILMYKNALFKTKWRHVDERSDDCRNSPDISGNKLFVIRRHVTHAGRGDWRTAAGTDWATSPTRRLCVDYMPVLPEPTPARPLHNGLAGIVRQRAGDRPVAERMRRSTGLARSASAQAPPDACPLAIGSCGWCVALLTRRRGGRE